VRGMGRWIMGGPKVRGDARLQDAVKLRVIATRAEEQEWVALRGGDATGDDAMRGAFAGGRQAVVEGGCGGVGGVESRNHEGGA